MYPDRRTRIGVALALCTIGVTAAQEDKSRATQPAAVQSAFRLGAGGRPTARRLAASQAATRAVALCSGLWSGGRSIEQINADNGGLGGTESGLLYLNDGMWNGDRILPEGWAKFVSTPGPVQPAGSGARYGAQFWIYGGIDGLPSDAYSPSGGQGQYAMIIPSHNAVIVRRGFDAGVGFKIEKFCADVLAAMD